MRFTFRTKLVAIVGVAALAFIVLIVTSAVTASRVSRQLDVIEAQYIPKVELGPQLESQFDNLRRALQDAVAARDADALDDTKKLHDEFVGRLAAAAPVVNPTDAAALRTAMDDYYADVVAISRRMMNGETGEAFVDAVAAMQAKQTTTAQLLKKVTAFDRGELAGVFATAADAQATGGRLRLWVGFACLAFVIFLSVWLSRGVLESVGKLTEGFARFGRGEFDKRVEVTSRDELADVAVHANQMAENLKRLNRDRDRTDWLKAGHADLARELRGELEPSEAATRAVRVLARHIEAPVAALYYADDQKHLRLLGRHALVSAPDDALSPSFRPGDGLVGQAALQEDIIVIAAPPADYLRVRSGLGESAARAIVLVPLLHLGKVTGVLEFALFKPWSDDLRELLASTRETLTVALEVARARKALEELLLETQRQAQKLTRQEEELQASNEELQAQQEELQQSNEELAQQAEELEEQRRTLEKKNVELDDARRGLERKADELTKVSAYKSQFLANMSHELRTPLNSMLLLSSLLSDNEAGNLTAQQVEFCKTIHSAGKDLLALINQVLDLAKVEAGKQQVRIDSILLRDLVEYAQRVFGPLASDKGLAFHVELSPDLPEAIATDPQRIQQVITNLLANAIKFTERGSVTLRVARPEPGARLRRADLSVDRTVAFVVSDTGVGIAPEHQERIFVPFEQVDGASDRRYGGTGLGLSIAREMTQLLGGELHLRSAPGRGSTFTCFLPFESSAAPAKAATVPPGSSLSVRVAKPAQASQGNGSVRPAGGHLLLIEDDKVFAERLGDVIRSQGLEYVWARDGLTGLRLARENQPSGIILDVKLPDVDGFTIMERLRSDPATADVPVHFLSVVDAAERGMAMGAFGYLTKPTTKNELVRLVQSLAPTAMDRACRILVVEDDGATGDSLVKQLTAENLEARRVSSAKEALDAVDRERFACMILDLSLPDMDGLTLLRSLQERCGAEMPAVVVYTGRALSKVEATRLEEYAEAVVLKEGPSAERLVDEIRLFVRRLKEGLGPRRAGAKRTGGADVRLDGKKVLVADDDMRTVYALSATLRAKGAVVYVADTGKAALDVLAQHPEIEAVLMDIMMPEMDGYEAMKRIRAEKRFDRLPIVALTAKAMKGDKEKCLELGASDYLPKPIDSDSLLAILHARLVSESHGA
jgi:signal transduction histidine kinase/CheY-like chemotaxis protein